jgi:hypothetical protein
MSKIVYLCSKEPDFADSLREDIEAVSKRIIPDNICARAAEILESDGIAYGIINPTETIEKNGSSVLMGQAFEEDSEWWLTGTPGPDGSYAIFRADEFSVELLTDVVASRTIWYFMDEEVFMASTSQRALVMLMKSFEFNPKLVSWMLSTGSLGPFNSWDSRIKMVPPDSVVSLNRLSWEIETVSQPTMFLTEKVSDAVHQERLAKGLTDTFSSLKLDFRKWALPLSGGFDSRSILCFFKSIGQDISKLRTITWGIKESAGKDGNDASVAKKVAGHFKVHHTYYPTDLGSESIEEILNRFLICGEGRVDHLSGYMDGFKIWKTLYEDNIEGIIRGDESFGLMPVDSSIHVCSRLGITLCTDFSNLEDYREYGIACQEFPDQLQLRAKESLGQWRDRLYQQFRVPVILSALNDLKLSYVEVINPLLSKKIIFCTRQIPDNLRLNKALFKTIVNKISPQIEYANSSAILDKREILRWKPVADLLTQEVNSDTANGIFSRRFLKKINANISTAKNSSNRKSGSLKGVVSRYMPSWLKGNLIKIVPKPAVDNYVLAFRIFMTTKMYRLLTEDAEILENKDKSRSDLFV